MKGRLRTITKKAFALIMATAMSMPTAALAAEEPIKLYGENSSVMGLAENSDEKKEVRLSGDNSVQKETDSYKMDMRASFDTLDKIIYEVKISKKTKSVENNGEVDAIEDLGLNFTPNPNSSIKEIKLLSAKALSPQGSKDITFEENTNKAGLDGLKLKGAIEDEIVLEIAADIRKAEDSRTYDMLVSLFSDKDLQTFSYNLIAGKEIIKEDDKEIEKINLNLDDKERGNLKGVFEGSEMFGLLSSKANISWTDYLANETSEKKEIAYEFKLDDKQETKDSKINIDYYENTQDGYILKKEFSQSIDFANKIEFEIPANYIAKLSLKTKVDKNNTDVKFYSLNNRQVKNPAYKEKEKNPAEDDEEDHQADSKKEEKPNESDKKDTDIKIDDKNNENDKESDTEITATDSNGKEVPVEIKENTDEEIRENESSKISALILNKDSLLSKLEAENKLDEVKKSAIENLASDLDSYNDEKITDQELMDFTKKLAENYAIEKNDLKTFIEAILSGLNKETNKAANLNIDEIIDYVYPEEVKPEEKDQSQKADEDKKKLDLPSVENLPKDGEEKEPAEENTDPGKKSDEDLANLEDEAKKEENKTGLIEGLKNLVGLSDLAKADKELKRALADESKTLEEIQSLLDTFETKYNLSKADQAKLMDENGDAIRALVEKDKNTNLRPHIFANTGANDGLNLDNKKFTVRTIFKTSNAAGPVKKGQNFIIHLDKKLTVKEGTVLEAIRYNNEVIATPKYNPNDNTIEYTITRDINENIEVPLEIPVDYNTAKITEDDFTNGIMTVTNKVSGLGVISPKDLVPQKMDKNGNPAGSIIEPGRDDVVKIIDNKNGDYSIYTDTNATPVIENGKLVGYNWTIKVTSDTDLSELGYKANFTLVKGSGLGEIEDRSKSLQNFTDQLEGAEGINDSKHHSPGAGKREITYNLYTPVEEIETPQEKYMMDISIVLLNKEDESYNKIVGAKRVVIDEGWPLEKVKEATPNRVGINNRTTILGEYTGENKTKWTVTDAISTGDPKTTFPLEKTRTFNDRPFVPDNTYIYQINTKGPKKGQMVKTTSNIEYERGVGAIAVYDYERSFGDNDQNKSHTLGGVTISKYQDIVIDQHWNLPDGQDMPEQTITVTDNKKNPYKKVGEQTGKERTIVIPGVKYWDIADNGKATMRDHTISQTFPEKKVTIDGKEYKYSENANYFRPDTKIHYIHNSLDEDTDKKPASFTVVKVDSENPEKRIQGASFDLLGANVSVITDANGEATFTNIKPGTYYLTETNAPDGYKIDQNQKTITISDTGQISVSGSNAKLSAGSGKTAIVEHSDYPNWPDYMNAMHYGKLDNRGNLEFYVYLKPFAPRLGGKTDKDTRFNISIPGVNLTNTEVKVYDLNPDYREYYTGHMENQTMDQAIVYNDVTNVANNGGKITGTENYKDPYTGKTGYSIFFPEARFGTNWGFLVKVKAKVGTDKNPVSLSYDWLANENTATNSKIQEAVTISTNQEENGHPTITITNEPFKKSPIEVAKFADSLDNDGNRIKLPGAEFVLKDAKGNPITTAYTDEDGKINFGEFPPGTYYLEEQAAPAGYEKSDVYFEVRVNEKGEVTYTAKFKTSSGTPVPGQDYFIDKGEATSSDAKAEVLEIYQHMDIKDSSRGRFSGVWEAYELESLKYKLDARLNIKGPGSRFEIQFDKNLDFTQYFTEFPDIYDDGQVIAKPYFDRNTNLLTYVFTENATAGDTIFSLNLVGMIPNKFYAKTHGQYPITNVVQPGTTIPSNIGNQTETINVDAYFGEYDAKRDLSHKPLANPPTQVYYFRDVYQDNSGQWYVKAFAYYNPLGLYSGGARSLRFNWMSTNYQQNKIQHEWNANGNRPAFQLENVKVYRTDKRLTSATYYNGSKSNTEEVSAVMPLSMGIRPEQDPSTYRKVFETSINPDSFKSASSNDVYLEYDPKEIKTDSTLQYDAPLKMTMPRISGSREGYVIEQTFKIPDIKKFNQNWRAFYMGQNTILRSTFITGPNKNYGSADQTGQEIPKFYKEIVGIINRKFTPGQFKITKTEDNTGNALEGAIFALTDASGNTIYRSSDANGLVEFKDLEPGRYTLIESKAPEGHTGSKEKWEIIVSNDGSVRIEETSVTGSGNVYTGDNKNIINIPVQNRKTGENFQVFKKGDKGEALQGATFTITKQVKEGEAAYTAEKTSNEKGIVEFDKDLTEGTYIIEETKAPDGFNKLDQKWVLVIDDKGNKKVYNYSSRTDKDEKSLLGEEGTYVVNVKDRPQIGWESFDNRNTGWAGNSTNAEHLGTRIIAINKNKKYVVQRYIINPEAKNIDAETSATIHREKPNYPNMDWYNEKNANTDYKVFTLAPKKGGNTDGKVSRFVSDLRLADYSLEDITKDINKTAEADSTTHYGETRLKLTIPKTDKPIVVDVKVPYKDENGGVGTGMDWRENGITYWKSDYYERVSDIVLGDTFASEIGSIEGSYIGEDSLDVINEPKTYGFKIKKVKEGETEKVIPGAVFKLTGPDPLEDERFMTTGSDGMVSFDGLKTGKYTLVETEPAPGYEKSNVTWNIRVTNGGKVYIKTNKPASVGQDRNAEVIIQDPDAPVPVAPRRLFRSPMRVGLLESASETNAGLEIGDILADVTNPLRAGDGWEVVDNTSSTQPTKREDASDSEFSQLIETKIIEIDKANDKYKQVFIFKEGLDSKARELKFHVAYDNYNINTGDVKTRVFQVPISSLSNINESSDIDNIANKTDISSKIRFTNVQEETADGRTINKIKTTNLTATYSGTILVETEMDYNENQPIGLGSNYNFNTTGQHGNKCWLEKSYPNEASVPVVKTTVNHTITFDGNGGQWQMNPVTVEDNKLYELPGSSFIAPEGKEFDGWLVNRQKKNPGEKITVTRDLTITAQWRKKAPEQVNVSFIPGEGSGTMKPVKVDKGSTYKLPSNGFDAPNRKEFKAWDVSQSEKQPGDEITVNANVTIKALWKDKAPTTYNVIVENLEQEDGTISADKASASAGTQINLTITPKYNYQIQSVTMNGEPLTADTDGKYKFTMPKGDATVSATFKKKEDKPEAGEEEIPEGSAAHITNKQTGLELNVFKVNNLNRRLAGAEFTIQKYEDETYSNLDTKFPTDIEGRSDENGLVQFKDTEGKVVSLPVGHYIITESKSPQGYKKAQAPWKLEVYEESGQLKAKYSGPEDTANGLLTSNKAKAKSNDSTDLQTTANGIKYKSRLTYINPESKTYIQRIYIDTREYTGDDKINVQITPKYKRDETDEPGKLPVTNIEGVKTAYRSTYKITGGVEDSEIDNVLRYYDLSKPNVSMTNTARWRPFDWGFDEDLLNLDKGVYFIDVEGFYDDAIITGIDKHLKDEDGNPTVRTNLETDDKNYINSDDLGKLDLNIDFYDGERKFQQRTKDENGNLTWTDGTDFNDAYLLGNVVLGYVAKNEKGQDVPTAEGLKKADPHDKYPLWLGKTGGRIDPALTDENRTRVETSVDISSLYASDSMKGVPQDGLTLTNEEETYNITFSKHGRDNPKDDINSEKFTNKRLEGAIFKLQQDNGITYEDVPGSFVASAFNGYFGFRALKPGRYRLMEVQAPEGYKPINDPLLYFTVETITTNSGKIVHPVTGDEVDIKSIKVKFPGNEKVYNLSELTMVDPKDENRTTIVNIEDVESKDIDIETALIVDPNDSTKKVALKDLSIPGDEVDYVIGHTRVVEGKSGYISLEYDKANGVYQYVPEKSTTTKEGKLIDFVTSATAKNMGKIINEKPGEGSVRIKKYDQNNELLKDSNLLKGAEFKLINISNGEQKTGTIGKEGTLDFDNLQIGNYRLVETKSPDGYENTGQVWNFTVGGEGLDPYAGEIARTGDNLSDKIKFETTEFKINNPQKKTSTKIEKGTTATLKPHVGESMEFTNKYTLDADIKINPGDYFVLEMTDNMDLNGIFENEIENLDILAPGVGTIAKAEYDRNARTITYTFTDYAKTYNLVSFSNRLTGFIDLYKVKKSGEQTVGFGIDKNNQDDTSQHRNIDVKYELDYARGAKWNNTYENWDRLNMVSKIVHYDQETGDFVQYYYINRLDEYSNQYTEFLYRPEQDVEYLNISIKNVSNQGIRDAMPESFGIENANYGFRNTLSLNYLEGGQDFQVATYFLGEKGLGSGKHIIKVTGRVAGDDKSKYYAEARLIKHYNDGGNLGVERFDEIYAFKNEAIGEAKLEIQAVNPENKITFSKVDQNGKALTGAKFKLRSKVQGNNSWSEGEEKETDDDGILTFTKLKPGEYELIETHAPDGHKMGKNPVVKFKVDKNGKITREVKSEDGKVTTTEDVTRATIYVENKKEQEIEFKKIDAIDKTALEGAEFEVWYKLKKDDEYSNKNIKLYKKNNEDDTIDRLVLKEGSDVPDGYSLVDKFTTDGKGLVKFKIYEAGYYALKEVKAPDGYIAPRDFVEKFVFIDDKIQTEQYKTEIDVDKTKSYFYANGLHDVYNTDITMRFNPDNEKITYEKDKSKITLSGLPLNNEYYENNISQKTGISIEARLVNSRGKSSPKTYEVDLNNYDTNYKGKITIDLYELVKELEKKTGDSFESENTIELSMYSTLALNTTLDITSKIEIGEGEDKFSEERTFNIGTEGDKKVDHSYTFTKLGEPDTPILVENRKGEYPLTGGPKAWIGFTILGLVLMTLAGFYYNKKKTIG